ncbi:MAG: hypothetical protein AAFP87_12425 [Pseudomonadota bacterium]
MDSEITEILEAAIGAYTTHFQMMSSFGIALFGASVFIVSRSVGIIHDEKFVESRANWLAFVTAVMGLLVVLVGYVVNNAIANFHVDLLRTGPTFCAFPADRLPSTFFMDCYRVILQRLVQLALVFSALGIFSLLAWVGVNIWRKTK